jgi:hypothetical protein
MSGHTNLIPWIVGSGKIPLLGGREKIKMPTSLSGISEQQEENCMIFPRLPYFRWNLKALFYNWN